MYINLRSLDFRVSPAPYGASGHNLQATDNPAFQNKIYMLPSSLRV